MIRMKDGAILAQMGNPDMKEPIQYALTYPKRENLHMNHLDFSKVLQLEFCHLDMMISRLFVLLMK